MHKLYIFDLDQTLIDSGDSITWAMQTALQRNGIRDTPNHLIRKGIGLALDEMVAGLNPDKRVPDISIINTFREIFRSNWKTLNHVFPGVPNLLKQLKEQGKKLAILTSKHTRSTKELLRFLQLEKYFDLICGVDSTLRPKPFPDGIYLIQKTLQIPDKETLMIGDHIYDIQMAANAGISAIAVTTGYYQAKDFIAYKKTLYSILDNVNDLLSLADE